MLSFVCLLVFIILVYVPGSTLNVIENSSGSLVSNNFEKTTLIRTTTTPLSSLSTSLPSVLPKELISTIESIKLHQTKPSSFTYNYQQQQEQQEQTSHNIVLNQNQSILNKTIQQTKFSTGSVDIEEKDDDEISLTLTNKNNNTRIKQTTNLPVFLKYSSPFLGFSSPPLSPLSFHTTTTTPTSTPIPIPALTRPTKLTSIPSPIPIAIPQYPLLVTSLPTIGEIEFLTTTATASPNEFKGSFSNRGGRSSMVTKFPIATTKSTTFVKTNKITASTTTTTTTSTPIRPRTVKITKKNFYESSLSSSSSSSSSTAATSGVAPTLSSPSALLKDGYINITSQAGTHAYLPCNVKQLVKKPVSWIRVRDGHILTVDQTTFIADQRFQSIYTQNTERWSLQIKYVQTKDAGAYECQVSTEPKTSSLVRLQIVEPKTEMIGEMNRHVKAGSRVTIRCIISEALEPPLFVNWFFNDKQIFLVNQNGWRTEIDRTTLPIGNYTENHTTIASLIIPSVRKKDSGNYTCNPSNSESITVVLHVLNGEYSASAITSGGSSSKQYKFKINLIQQQITIIVMLLICFHLQALIEI